MIHIKRISLYLFIVLSIVIVCVGTYFSVQHFYNIQLEKIHEVQKQNLQDIAKLEAKLLGKKLHSYIDSLHTITELLHVEILNSDINMKHIYDNVKTSGFQQLGIIDIDGTLFNTDGYADVSDREYYQDILKGKTFVSEIVTSRITGKDTIIMAVPIYDGNGKLYGALQGSIFLDAFKPYSNTSLAAGNSVAYVFDRDGKYMVKSSRQEGSWDHSNIFEHLKETQEKLPIKDICSSIEQGQVITAGLFFEQIDYLGFFIPIRHGEWYALLATPRDELDTTVIKRPDTNLYRMLASILFLMSIYTATLFVLYLRTIHKKKHEVELHEKLMEKVVGLMVADMEDNKILSLSGQGVLSEGKEKKSYSDYMEYILQKGLHPQYTGVLFRFFSMQNIRFYAAAGYSERSTEFRFRYMPDGDYVWLECESRVETDKASGHLIVTHILRDIDIRKKEELFLRHNAERDMLTGLYNRSTASKCVDRLLTSCSGDEHALILLDLDNFKTLNDTLGHQFGDKALKDVASILTSHFRKNDLVCRLGGDEFFIFLNGISQKKTREKLFSLMQKLHLTFENEGRSVQITASAGLVFASAGDSFEGLYPKADQALYKAKHSGKAIFWESRLP